VQHYYYRTGTTQVNNTNTKHRYNTSKRHKYYNTGTLQVLQHSKCNTTSKIKVKSSTTEQVQHNYYNTGNVTITTSY